jgi:hypothetical protein
MTFIKINVLVVLLSVILLGVVVFNTTFNNISVISWRSVLLVEETRENLYILTL